MTPFPRGVVGIVIHVGLAAVSSFALPACEPPPPPAPPGPAETYDAFARAVRSGDADTAWSLVDAASRTRLDASAKAVAAARGLSPPRDGRRILLESGGRAPVKPKETRASSVEGSRAVVTVVDVHGEAHDVPLLLEDGRWRIDVSSMLPVP